LYILACVHCRGNVFIEPLTSNEGGIEIHTHRSKLIVCVSSFIKIGRGVTKAKRKVSIKNACRYVAIHFMSLELQEEQ
jgi:hypothetical protein